jgi:hypothetical protein
MTWEQPPLRVPRNFPAEWVRRSGWRETLTIWWCIILGRGYTPDRLREARRIRRIDKAAKTIERDGPYPTLPDPMRDPEWRW